MLLAINAISPLKAANPDASIRSLGQPVPTPSPLAAPALSPCVTPVRSSAPALNCALICGVPFSKISAAPETVLPPKSASKPRKDRRRSDVSVRSVVISTERPNPRGKSAPPNPNARKNASVSDSFKPKRPATSPIVLARPFSDNEPPDVLICALNDCTSPAINPEKFSIRATTSTSVPTGRNVA